MRDDFCEKTKQLVAKRVAWKCSFPGCDRITIGPGSNSDASVVNIGEAAHIYAASAQGPRYDPTMLVEERISINNAIWMCRIHARLIDADYTSYSPSTLLQWKEAAERNAYQNLKEFTNDRIANPTTLISLRHNLIFEGVWKSATDDKWLFEILSFIEGDMELLKDHSINFQNKPEFERYVVVESQGDGREINGLAWSFNNGKYHLLCSVLPKSPRISPNELGSDIALGDDFDLITEDGDFNVINGIDLAIQTLRLTLSSEIGDYKESPLIGSFVKRYFCKYNDNQVLLNRLIKMEIVRLLSVSFFDNLTNTKFPELNFINRVLDVQVIDASSKQEQIAIKIKLEWGDGQQWNGEINFYIDAGRKCSR